MKKEDSIPFLGFSIVQSEIIEHLNTLPMIRLKNQDLTKHQP